MNCTGNMDNESVHLRATGTEKHVHFEIENGTPRGTVGVVSPVSVNSHGSSEKTSRNSFSVLKTLFFILLWYSCSLFLTL